MNIDEILEKELELSMIDINVRNHYKEAIKEIVKGVLDMAAENARVKSKTDSFGDYETTYSVDKDSIKQTITQITF